MADCNYVRSKLNGNRLFGYVTRRLDDGLQADVNNHAGSCGHCFDYLKGAETMFRAFKIDNGSQPSPASSRGLVVFRRFRDQPPAETVAEVKADMRGYAKPPEKNGGFFYEAWQVLKRAVAELRELD